MLLAIDTGNTAAARLSMPGHPAILMARLTDKIGPISLTWSGHHLIARLPRPAFLRNGFHGPAWMEGASLSFGTFRLCCRFPKNSPLNVLPFARRTSSWKP